MPEPIPFYGMLEDCQHCWHETGVTLLSLPPQHQERCCYCGEHRYLKGRNVVDLGDGHGKFFPRIVS
jgi:hypothetical protein